MAITKYKINQQYPMVGQKCCGISSHPSCLTHWGRVTHICVGKLNTIGSDNGLSPGRRQAIIWTIAGILLIGTLGTNLSEILIGNSNIFIQENAFENVVCEMASICLGLNVLTHWGQWWLSTGPLANVSRISIKMTIFSCKIPSKMLSAKWWLFISAFHVFSEGNFKATSILN